MQTGLKVGSRSLTAVIGGLLLCFQIEAKEYGLQVLHVFESPGPLDPGGGVLRTSDGSLYGVTPAGNALEGGNGSGTIYRIAPDGQISVLAVFNGPNGPYGYYPTAGLTAGNDGGFYGSTRGPGPNGAWTSFFRITSTGNFTNIVSLYGDTNGFQPEYAMLQASDGNLYGTTTYGGAGYNENSGSSGGGTVFKFTPEGNFTLLNSFIGTNGFQPMGRLMESSNGNIYGTTALGGQFSRGTIFSISVAGGFQVIHSFDNADGIAPQAGLVEARNGWLYGTGVDDGFYGYGAIFRASTNGNIEPVAFFNGSNGRFPVGSLVQGDGDELFGVAKLGGLYDGGTAFRLTTNNVIQVIASFSDTTGRWPTELTKGGDGNFYGTTAVLGGPFGSGTVFRLVQLPEIYSTSISNGLMHLSWTAFANGVYQVEFKNSWIESNWTVLSGRIVAATNSASFLDTNPSPISRFYRVTVLPR